MNKKIEKTRNFYHVLNPKDVPFDTSIFTTLALYLLTKKVYGSEEDRIALLILFGIKNVETPAKFSVYKVKVVWDSWV